MFVRHILIFLCIVLFFGCKEASKKEVATLPIEDAVQEEKIRESTFEDLKGNPIELADYKGKKVFLNYWATWCRPCVEEMPAMARLQTALEKENYVFLYASDQSVAKITKFKEARDFDFKYIKFNGALAEQQITALPVTMIFNEAGERIERFDGGIVWDTPEMIQKLKEL